MSDEEAKEAEPSPAFVPQPGHVWRREDFTLARVKRIADELAQRGAMPLMSEEARKASLRAIRAAVPEGEDVWVFAYGSLMWNPAILVAESRKAHVRGYHRTFCLTLSGGRGSVEKPGLMLAVDRGGSCTGIAHRIAADKVESELTVLWYREMLSGAYEPRWINADVEEVGRNRALAFVINRSHPRYEGILAEETIAQRIAVAAGQFGTNRDYLYHTETFLNGLGVADRPIQRLAAAVRAIAADTRSQGAET